MEDMKSNAEIIQALAEGNVLVESGQRRGKSHAYNRKCQKVVLQAGYFKMTCNRPTKQGRLYCEKHRDKPKVSPEEAASLIRDIQVIQSTKTIMGTTNPPEVES